MSRLRWFVTSVLACSLAAGCRAQVPGGGASSAASPIASSIDRRIEVLIRSQFSVPSDYDVQLGARGRSDLPGYETLPVTFSHHGKQTSTNFLISADGKTLARLEKYDLSRDPATAIAVDSRPVRGDAAAKVEIVNFDDLECPYCARMHSELADQTLAHYKGLVKIVYKDYPLEEIHPWAIHAAVDANCLADQSATAYWAYVDYVHAHGQDIGGPDRDTAKTVLALDNIANTFAGQDKLDAAKLAACTKKQDESAVRASIKLGNSLNIEGTPQVFVNGERLAGGAQPLDQLWAAIDRALKAEGIQPPAGAPPSDNQSRDGSAGKPGR